MGWILLGSPLSLSLSSAFLRGSFPKPLTPQRTQTDTRLHHKEREARLSKPQARLNAGSNQIWSWLAVKQPRGMLCGRAMDWAHCSVSENALKSQHTAQGLDDAAIHQQIINSINALLRTWVLWPVCSKCLCLLHSQLKRISKARIINGEC